MSPQWSTSGRGRYYGVGERCLFADEGHGRAAQEASHLGYFLVGHFFDRHPPGLTQMGIESGEVAVADEGFGREGDHIGTHIVSFFGCHAEEVVLPEDLFHEGDVTLVQEAFSIDQCTPTAHRLEGAV